MHHGRIAWLMASVHHPQWLQPVLQAQCLSTGARSKEQLQESAAFICSTAEGLMQSACAKLCYSWFMWLRIVG
jgi:hypothetical protein